MTLIEWYAERADYYLERKRRREMSMADMIFDVIERAGEWLRCALRLCDDCERCETYVCPSCFRRLPWPNGCADALGDICDDCWAEWEAQVLR